MHPRVELGGSYSFIRARSDKADEPLDFLPHHKADAWVRDHPAADPPTPADRALARSRARAAERLGVGGPPR